MLPRTTHVTLLERLGAGDDHAAWREFCHRYGDLIRGVARRAGATENDADDVLQDVLMALVGAMPGFRYDPSKGRFRGYLKTIVVRALARRRQKHAPALLSEADEVASGDAGVEEHLWEDEWRQHHLRLAMRVIDAEFTVHDRAAFQRYAVEGRPVADVASSLGLSADQVYQAKSRILRRLIALVAQQVAEEG